MKITKQQALAHLRALCENETQKEVARKMGISPQHLNDLIRERRTLAGVSPYALAAVGLRMQVTIEWDLEEPA